MKASALLKKQHRELEALFKEIEKTEAPAKRRTLLGQIMDAIKLHSAIEEKIYYPATKAIGTQKAEDMVMEALEEHHVVDLVLAELPKVDPAADTFAAKMTVLKELIAHHVKEEEEELFPMAEKRFGAERSEELAEELAAAAARREAA